MLAPLLAACTGPPEPSPEPPQERPERTVVEKPREVVLPSDETADEPMPGELVITQVDRSRLLSDGTVRYDVKNVSGGPLEVIWAVQFFHTDTDGKYSDAGHRSEMSEELERLIAPSEVTQLVTTSIDREPGERILTTRLWAYSWIPLGTVPRQGDHRGTRFLDDGALECVALTGLWERPPFVDFTLENVSPGELTGLEVKAILVEPGGHLTVLHETEWVALPDVLPGKRVQKRFDLGMDVYGKSCCIRVRRAREP